MRLLASLVALVIIVIGIVGLVAPDRLMTAAQYVLTPVGLYAIAALRMGMGLVLVLVAPTSRAPKTLRALGTIVLVAGLATPLFGVERARGVAEWAAAHGPALLRSVAVVMLAIGSAIACAVGVGRRA
jgi:hypothetical protein